MNSNFKRILAIVALALTACIGVQAQFKFGPKVGLAVNGLHFSEDILKSDNRAGFVGGVMAEFTVPLIGVGADVSVLYQHRESMVSASASEIDKKLRGDYIDIPLNVKYKLSLPAISHIVAPFVTTGPDFSFLLSKENLNNALSDKKFDFGWNVGLGVELIRHIQVAASYGFGITSHVSGNAALNNSKNRCWTVTAAYLF